MTFVHFQPPHANPPHSLLDCCLCIRQFVDRISFRSSGVCRLLFLLNGVLDKIYSMEYILFVSSQITCHQHRTRTFYINTLYNHTLYKHHHLPGDSPSGVKLPINSLKLNTIPNISFRCSDNCSASCSTVDLVAEYRFVNRVLPLRSKMWRACTVISFGYA